MPDRAIVILVLAAVALVMTLVIMNANTVIRIRRPRPDQERAYLSEPVPPERGGGRIVRTVRRRRRAPGRGTIPANVEHSPYERYADPDPRYTGPPPVDPWYSRTWRMRRRARMPEPAPVEAAPTDGDDGTGTEAPSGVTEPPGQQETEVLEERNRLI